jgi:predicted ATPase
LTGADQVVDGGAHERYRLIDQRFRLLVGPRRGPPRHHTLRHAVAWSYEHLDDAEKALLDRCSVFAGGFDLQSGREEATAEYVIANAPADDVDAAIGS